MTSTRKALPNSRADKKKTEHPKFRINFLGLRCSAFIVIQAGQPRACSLTGFQSYFMLESEEAQWAPSATIQKLWEIAVLGKRQQGFPLGPRYFIVGKSNTSRMVVVSVRSMTRRSIPIPRPPVGGIPYSRAST